MKKLLAVILLLAIAGSAGWFFWQQSAVAPAAFRTAAVTRGDLRITISATGTVQPEEVIDVGAQVAGKINYFGKDPHSEEKVIDYGTEVEEGTVLAHIDDSLYASDAAQASAQVEQAKANVRRAEADLAQTHAKLRQAEQNWKRAQELGPSRALSATDYDSFKAEYETAQATVGVSEATLLQVTKSVAQAEATLKRAQTNLGYCTIRSPVKGVIIDRRVNIGQTVVASLNAPSLFLIAKDLKKMQVWAAVNEADIGNIHAGQPVSFTVDAFSGRTFHGQVGKVRLNASMTQNVVTYTVEITTDNSDGKLLPYLSANVRFEVAERKSVLMAPNAAMRWMPSAEQVTPEARETFAESPRRGTDSGREGAAEGGATNAADGRKTGRVWVQDGAFARPIRVTVGLSDDTMTEIAGDGLSEGVEVIVGEADRGDGNVGGNTTNPFAPQIYRGRRPG